MSRKHPRPRKHGMCRTRLYAIWCKMLARTRDPKNNRYSRYGGRGIKVCDEWLDFATFAKWALSNGYNEFLSIDRIDNDGNYCPENCRWATPKEQARNTKSVKPITFNGETHSVPEWAEKIGIPKYTLHKRLRSGWSVERALTEPVDTKYWHTEAKACL